MQTKHDSLLATGMNGVTIADHALTILHKSHGMKPMKSPAEMVLRHFSWNDYSIADPFWAT